MRSQRNDLDDDWANDGVAGAWSDDDDDSTGCDDDETDDDETDGDETDDDETDDDGSGGVAKRHSPGSRSARLIVHVDGSARGGRRRSGRSGSSNAAAASQHHGAGARRRQAGHRDASELDAFRPHFRKGVAADFVPRCARVGTQAQPLAATAAGRAAMLPRHAAELAEARRRAAASAALTRAATGTLPVASDGAPAGHRLYGELKRRQGQAAELRAHVPTTAARLETAAAAECTFRPAISDFARDATACRRGGPAETLRRLASDDARREHMLRLRAAGDAALSRQCTFAPEIAPVSDLLCRRSESIHCVLRGGGGRGGGGSGVEAPAAADETATRLYRDASEKEQRAALRRQLVDAYEHGGGRGPQLEPAQQRDLGCRLSRLHGERERVLDIVRGEAVQYDGDGCVIAAADAPRRHVDPNASIDRLSRPKRSVAPSPAAAADYSGAEQSAAPLPLLVQQAAQAAQQAYLNAGRAVVYRALGSPATVGACADALAEFEDAEDGAAGSSAEAIAAVGALRDALRRAEQRRRRGASAALDEGAFTALLAAYDAARGGAGSVSEWRVLAASVRDWQERLVNSALTVAVAAAPSAATVAPPESARSEREREREHGAIVVSGGLPPLARAPRTRSSEREVFGSLYDDAVRRRSVASASIDAPPVVRTTAATAAAGARGAPSSSRRASAANSHSRRSSVRVDELVERIEHELDHRRGGGSDGQRVGDAAHRSLDEDDHSATSPRHRRPRQPLAAARSPNRAVAVEGDDDAPAALALIDVLCPMAAGDRRRPRTAASTTTTTTNATATTSRARPSRSHDAEELRALGKKLMTLQLSSRFRPT